MKQKLRKLQFLFCTCLIVLLIGCNEQDDNVTNQHQKVKIEKKSFQELMQTQPFSQAMGLIKKQNSNKNRMVMEDKYAFTIYDTPINVMENDTLIAYNLLIKSDTIKKGNYFENLVININKATDRTRAYIVKFNLTSEITQTQHDSFYFESNPEIYEILYNDKPSAMSKANTVCYTYHTVTCTNDKYGNDGGAEHEAGPKCYINGGPFLHYSSTQVCTASEWEPNNFPGNENMPQHPNGSYGGGHITSNPVQPCNGCPKVKLEDLAINEKNCEKLNKLVAATLPNGTVNPFRTNLIQNKADALTNNYEKGYGLWLSDQNPNGLIGIAPLISGTNNCDQMKFKVYPSTIGFFHSHTASCGLSEMFSHEDMITLYTILTTYNNGNPTYGDGTPVDYSNFVMTVATTNGTYALKFTDVEAFKSKMQQITSSDKSKRAFRSSFEASQSKGRYDSLGNENTNQSNNEKNMLDMIKDLFGSGISLYRAKSDFSGFDRLVYENNQVTPKSCN